MSIKKLIYLFLLLFYIPLNAAITFDGTDDFCSVENSASINISGTALSISAIIKYIDNGAYQTIAGKSYADGANTDPFFLYGIDITNDDKVQFMISIGSTLSASVGTTSLTSGNWYVITCTFDGTTMRVYLNGVEDDNTAASGSIDAGTTKFRIGVNGAETSGHEPFSGIITEVAVWNYTLTQQDVNNLAFSNVKRMPLNVQPANLKLYLPMDDQPDGTSGDGDSYFDLSGNGNTATGVDGANNTGLTNTGEILSYPPE